MYVVYGLLIVTSVSSNKSIDRQQVLEEAASRHRQLKKLMKGRSEATFDYFTIVKLKALSPNSLYLC